MVHLGKGIPAVEQKSASEQSSYTGTISRFLPCFFLFLHGAMHPKDSLLKTPDWFVCSHSEALVRSRYCRAGRDASDAKYFIKVLGVTLYPWVPDFIKFFLLQLLVLFSNWRVRNSFGVSLLQLIFVHRIYVGLARVWEELQSCIQVTVSLLVICLL